MKNARFVLAASLTAITFTSHVSLCIKEAIASEKGTALCALKKCPSGTAQPYDDGVYKFATSSRVYKNGKQAIYETCVQNLGDGDLDFDWYIPGPDSWIPKGCALSNPRPMTSIKSLDSTKGCALYGNAGVRERFDFVPHESDRALLAHEKPDCLEDYAQAGTDQLPRSEAIPIDVEREAIKISGEVFAPTDEADVENTLQRIEYRIELVNYAEKGIFEQKVDYSTSAAYSQTQGKLSGTLSLRLTEPPDGGMFFADGSPIKETLALSKAGSILLQAKAPSKPELTSIRYSVLSSNGKPVASIMAPIWIEGTQ